NFTELFIKMASITRRFIDESAGNRYLSTLKPTSSGNYSYRNRMKLLFTFFMYAKSYKERLLPALVVAGLLVCFPAYSQVTSVAGINLMWNNPATWIGNVVPASNQDVVIPVGSAVVIDNYFTNTIDDI